MRCLTDFDGPICIHCISKYSSRLGLDPKSSRLMRGFFLDFCRLLVRWGQTQLIGWLVVVGFFW